ncbi:MAG TPA: DEAD/DEAH box helicase, partial [Blastococcus sp.]
MTSPSNSPTTSGGTGDDRPRRSRGARGRGGRPAGDQPTQAQPARTHTAPAAVPTPVVVPVGADATVLPTDTTFDALGVPAPLVEVLTTSGITSPFPIQVATLPDSLAGRDVLGRGRTGSGKTLAFSIPLVARLAASTSKRQPK